VNDTRTIALVTSVLALLSAATLVGQFLKRHPDRGLDAAAVRTFNQRLRGWWILCTVLAGAFWLGDWATIVLFWLVSLRALQEFITITPTRNADHRALFWVIYIFPQLHYLLVWAELHDDWGTSPGSFWLRPLQGLAAWANNYDVSSVFIPVYATLFVLARVAFAGDYKRFLERTAKIQVGLMICVYCLSFAAALLHVRIPGATTTAGGGNFRLLFFLILLVQFADCMQYVWSRMFGRHLVAPQVSSNRTWEGLLGSATSTALLAAALWWAAPPYQPWQAALAGLVVATMGFAGGMTMSAIKRDRGVKDYGTLVVGHGGVLDRIDSTCFAAPVFYHLTLLVTDAAR
jgi:phosphatidate cytidylyltransferase